MKAQLDMLRATGGYSITGIIHTAIARALMEADRQPMRKPRKRRA